MSLYNVVASLPLSTVVAECEPTAYDASEYQSEAQLEADFIARLEEQGYERISLPSEQALINNLRIQLEALNRISFSDGEWERFFREKIASQNEGIVQKTRRIQEDHVQVLEREDGSFANIYLIDKLNIHNNRLQVLNQYSTDGGKHKNRYDVTILVNGLPLVHVELKRRGVALREAFNQINRYQRESFWADSGLFEYVQIFVISNGTNTKYYSNTTRFKHLEEQKKKPGGSKKGSHSFEFTSFWADATNRNLPDLVDFTRTFFAKHTLLNILTRYCVFTSDEMLLVMRPYQIVATERILNRILSSSNLKQMGSTKAGGYIWHTTGSGKTLTSFKTAQLATRLEGIDKVLFVVDRKDLDYQTMAEYDKFEKGAANSNSSTKILQKQLEDPAARIIITTIQKLDLFTRRNPRHPIYSQHVVLIFDECHRSQFGEMRKAITKSFRNYHIFGFTGTPIFAVNARSGAMPGLQTTEQAFGERLHTYTIVDAINDGNVLPFRVDYINTMKVAPDLADADVAGIKTDEALNHPERIQEVVAYLLENFDRKTRRDAGFYSFKGGAKKGFNSILATSSIAASRLYYSELKKQIAEKGKDIKLALIYSFTPNEDDPEAGLPDEGFENELLDAGSRDFLEAAIQDYNQTFGTTYDTSADKFENYYRDVSKRVKEKELDLLVVVNMFLTGFDAVTLNTLWVDKNLRQHGLIQAFSRTNRILNTVKTYGNIVCFRDLSEETDAAIALFGDKEAGGIVLMRTFEEYYNGYEHNGRHQRGYRELVESLQTGFPLGQPILGEAAQIEFIKLYGAFLRMRNILVAFDEFEGKEILSERHLQDYQSRYIDLYQTWRPREEAEKASIKDDLIFEVELIRQVDINIDYILMLVAKYKASNCEDKEILASIDRAIGASLILRSKRELIEGFVATVNVQTDIEGEWPVFVREQKESDLRRIIEEENLKPERTRIYIENALKDGQMRTTGTDFDDLLPPMSMFDERSAVKKKTVLDKLRVFFEKYLGLGD